MIGNPLTHETDPAALDQILDVWTSGDGYEQRIDRLRVDAPAINASTLLPDFSIDFLFGRGGRDWFLLGSETLDEILDQAFDEVADVHP